jgi:hypothetical protein
MRAAARVHGRAQHTSSVTAGRSGGEPSEPDRPARSMAFQRSSAEALTVITLAAQRVGALRAGARRAAP